MSTASSRIHFQFNTATVGRNVSRRPLLSSRQDSFGSFTTEDTDVFHHSALHPKKVSPPVCRRELIPSDITDLTSESAQLTRNESQGSRQRSKSVETISRNVTTNPDENLLPPCTSENQPSQQNAHYEDKRLSTSGSADISGVLGGLCCRIVTQNSLESNSKTSQESPPAIPPRSPLPGRKVLRKSDHGHERPRSGRHSNSSDGFVDSVFPLGGDLAGPHDSDQKRESNCSCHIEIISAGSESLAVESHIDDESHLSQDCLRPKEMPRSPMPVRKLSHSETCKLSHRLTYKMSRRQRHAFVMDNEFDEFDDLDIVVEGESDSDSDSGDKPDELRVHRSRKQKHDIDSDNSDAEMGKRAVKLNFERLQVEGREDDIKGVEMSKTQRIANELLSTERTYVKKLHLIDQVFHFEVIVKNREFHFFPDEVVPQMFTSIKSIYQFHHDFLLPQLEQRMASWQTMPRIGDVMKKFAPFLKLYTDYVKNFDHAMETINFWTEKSPKFAALLEELQKLPECGHLTLQHHMLEPVQRVPRYELLLRDYLKHLDADADDRENTESAMALVATAAIHSNEAMRKIEKFRKLLDINESLGDENIDLISPTRELIKEGKIMRISAKDGDRYERYLMLFNDLLLVCHSLAVVIGSKQRYKIKSKIDVDGMRICDGNNLEVANTFIVKGRQKSIEFLANSSEETLEWITAIENAIADFRKKLMSRKASLQLLDVLDVNELGKRAPTWIKDQETSMCMRCSDTFTAFRRRHHCRACGMVVCNKCSTRKMRLIYDDNRENRVCDDCFTVLQRTMVTDSDSLPPPCDSSQPQQQYRKKGPAILQVKASDPSIISGYLNMSGDRKTWHKRFFAIHPNFVLYSFKAHQDVAAMTSLPLPGYRPSIVTSSADGSEDKFRISHRGDKKTYYFQADSRTARNRWVEVLDKVVRMELPDPVVSTPALQSPTREAVRGCLSQS